MEKYGFVYIWYDRKHKRYYIGSHWGYEDDGYICSSVWMKQAYKRRPQDFKRKIIIKIYSNRKDLLEEESRYLSMIKSNEIKIKYYNLTNKIKGHWSTDDIKYEIISEKISSSSLGKKKSKETIEKRKQTCKEKNIKFDWNKGKKYSDEEKKIKYNSRMGKIPWNKGIKQGPHKNPRKPYSEEAKKTHKKIRGPAGALKAWETKRNKNIKKDEDVIYNDII